MHIHIDSRNIRLWCHRHATPLAASMCGLLLSVLTASSSSLQLDGYLRVNLPGSNGRLMVTDQRPVQRGAASSSTRSVRARRIVRRAASAAVVRISLSSHRSSAASSHARSITMLRSGPQLAAAPVHTPAPDHAGTTPRHAGPPSDSAFPAFTRTAQPVANVPAWGDMTTPTEWNRSYAEMGPSDFVSVPDYDLSRLTVPLQELINPRNNSEITRKLYYSTRWFGAYDIDAGEFTGNHPGVDLKVALGTPVRAIAGGRVVSVTQNDRLGLYAVIEHRHPTDGAFYSVYAHLGSASVGSGDAVEPGQTIGAVGMTGNTSGPHLHLQVDRGEPGEAHLPYTPASMPSRDEATRRAVNPVNFIGRYANGE